MNFLKGLFGGKETIGEQIVEFKEARKSLKTRVERELDVKTADEAVWSQAKTRATTLQSVDAILL